MKQNIIYQTKCKTYRILEILDETFDFENLAGDSFNPEINTEMDLEQLRKEESAFKRKIENEGVYGYVLEKWNASPGCGYESIDSCWGFVGRHKDENHYIVDELFDQIPVEFKELDGVVA